jgi:hypothetical protein
VIQRPQSRPCLTTSIARLATGVITLGALTPSTDGGTIGLMRRLLTWALVSLGIAAVARRLRRRERHDELVPPADDADPAAELRQKLADSRADEEISAEPPVSPPVSSAASVEDRRASVHEQGRATVNEMRGPDGGDET